MLFNKFVLQFWLYRFAFFIFFYAHLDLNCLAHLQMLGTHNIPYCIKENIWRETEDTKSFVLNLNCKIHINYLQYDFLRIYNICHKNNSPRRGIEPRSPAWQAGILTTILPRTRKTVWNSSQLLKKYIFLHKISFKHFQFI